MTEPSHPMRIVAEPAPPLDELGELLLDDELMELTRTLVADAQHMSGIAEVSDLAAQLQHEAISLGEAAVVTGVAADPVAREGRVVEDASHQDRWLSRSNAWRPLWRVLPLAAAVLLVCFVAAPPRPPQHTTTIHLEPTPATATPSTTVPLRDAVQALPWQELSSPELEGALDLVQEAVSISI